MTNRRYKVVLFTKMSAFAVSDSELYIPGTNEVYAYSVKQELMRTFDKEIWRQAKEIQVGDKQYTDAVRRYEQWLATKGQSDVRLSERKRQVQDWQDNRGKRENEIIGSFDQYKVSALWHITHQSNLPSIIKYGILSHNGVRRRGLGFSDISDSEVQKRREWQEPHFGRQIHDYAPLYLSPRNPMLSRRRELQNQLCILEIGLRVLTDRPFLITNGNAASGETTFYRSVAYLDRLPWEVLRAEKWQDYPDGKRQKMAEVLVYPSIPPKFIQRVHCYLGAPAEELRKYGFEVQLSRNMFFEP